MWLRIDDGYPEHPKLARLTDGAFRAHVRVMAYCARYMTDGYVPQQSAINIAGKHLVELTTCPDRLGASLLEVCDGGFVVHDYLLYNPSREKVMAERERNAQRVARHRNGSSNGITDTISNTAPSSSLSSKDKTLKHSEEFEEFWEAYPRKVAKTATRKAWQARMKEGIDPSLLVRCSRNYAKTRVGEDEKYTAYPSTFLGPQHKYEDYAEAPKAAQVLYAKP